MIKLINSLDTIYDGVLVVDDLTKKEVESVWIDFSKDKNPDDFFDGDIYSVSDIKECRAAPVSWMRKININDLADLAGS